MTEPLPLRVVVRRHEGSDLYIVRDTRVYVGEQEVSGISRVTLDIEAGGGVAEFVFEAHAHIDEEVIPANVVRVDLDASPEVEA